MPLPHRFECCTCNKILTLVLLCQFSRECFELIHSSGVTQIGHVVLCLIFVGDHAALLSSLRA